MSKTHNNDLPAHLRCMTSQTRADYEGTKRPDIKPERKHALGHLSNKQMKRRGADYKCSKEPRTRDGQTYPGGRQLRKRLTALGIRRKDFDSQPKAGGRAGGKGTVGEGYITNPGSMN